MKYEEYKQMREQDMQEIELEEQLFRRNLVLLGDDVANGLYSSEELRYTIVPKLLEMLTKLFDSYMRIAYQKNDLELHLGLTYLDEEE